jgi:hypothetical protein
MASLGWLREGLIVSVTMAVGITLQSCSAQQPSPPASKNSPVFETSTSVVRVPLAPPIGYAPQEPLFNAPMPPVSAESSFADEAQNVDAGAWRESPRWAAIRGDGCVVAKQDDGSSANIRVEHCSEEKPDDRNVSTWENEPRQP